MVINMEFIGAGTFNVVQSAGANATTFDVIEGRVAPAGFAVLPYKVVEYRLSRADALALRNRLRGGESYADLVLQARYIAAEVRCAVHDALMAILGAEQLEAFA